ncbi:glutathione S-transferase [Leucosporidium creatinivorum]|uniref:Glutathione S-transferase n=1 Tax=Leucosporidium creatinivorum TaxID=106004 RepID=A0A1Y2FTW4_9BASI|nr:glutathione S-transferase [Leucosporidium creatinivorum]
MSNELKNVKLHYFPICGRGEPIRMMLEDAGIPYEESNDVAAFFASKMDCDEYRFNQLPRLEVNGLKLAQQDAILRYIAAHVGLGPSGKPEEDVVADMLGCAVEDLMSAYVKNIYSPDATTLLPEFAKTQAPKSFNQYEQLLSKSKSTSGYFVYDHPSFAEFHLYYTIYAISHLHPTLLASYPALEKWFNLMSSRPNLAAYFKSGRRKEILNGSPSGQNPCVEA